MFTSCFLRKNNFDKLNRDCYLKTSSLHKKHGLSCLTCVFIVKDFAVSFLIVVIHEFFELSPPLISSSALFQMPLFLLFFLLSSINVCLRDEAFVKFASVARFTGLNHYRVVQLLPCCPLNLRGLEDWIFV